MIIQGLTPTNPPPTLNSMFNAVQSNVLHNQTPQASTIVKLSTQGQALSLATTQNAAIASPASYASPASGATTSMAATAQTHSEANETRGQETNETGSVRLTESENSAQTTASTDSSANPYGAIQQSQYAASAVQNTNNVSVFA